MKSTIQRTSSFPIFSLSISLKGPGIKAETLRTEDRRHCPVEASSLPSTLEVNASHSEMSVYRFFLFRSAQRKRSSAGRQHIQGVQTWHAGHPVARGGSGRSLAGHNLLPARLCPSLTSQITVGGGENKDKIKRSFSKWNIDLLP